MVNYIIYSVTCRVAAGALLDVGAFSAYLQGSKLIPSPGRLLSTSRQLSLLTTRLYERYLTSTPPVDLKRVTTRPQSARWYDRGCRDVKRRIRNLERLYHRLLTSVSETAWRQQFDVQRQLYQSKFTEFWLTTVNLCG